MMILDHLMQYLCILVSTWSVHTKTTLKMIEYIFITSGYFSEHI